MAEYKYLNTEAFDVFIGKQSEFIKEYEAIMREYDSIVRDLSSVWKGRGADAFSADASVVKTNIKGLGDILKTMCDMLIDCKAVFDECDQSLSQVNKDAIDD